MMRIFLTKMLIDYCEEKGVEYEVLVSKSRKREIVESRYGAIRHLYGCGFTQEEIAREFNMNHSSINYYLYRIKIF